MKTFWQTIMRVFHKFLVWMTIAYVVLMLPLQVLCFLLGSPESLKNPATAYSYVVLFAYGVSRVVRFHPVFNSGYLMQLILSPWQMGKPLPRGPIYLNWADAVVVCFFMLLTYIFPVESPVALPFIFLIGYNLGLFLSFCATEQKEYIGVYFVLAPLVVYPHLNDLVSAIVLLLMTGIGLYGVRCYLKAFPWNTPWWTGNQVDLLKRQAVRRRVIQWPFSDLRTPSLFSGGVAFSLGMAALVFWYFHTIGWFIYQVDNERMDGPFYAIFFYAVIILRFFCYTLKYRAPISLFGRICTGRLIIPGYDIVFVGPVAVLLTGLFMPLLLRMIGAPAYIGYEVSISVCVFLALAIPPGYEAWVYTSQHRIAAIPIKPMPSVKKTQANEVIGNLFKKTRA